MVCSSGPSLSRQTVCTMELGRSQGCKRPTGLLASKSAFPPLCFCFLLTGRFGGFFFHRGVWRSENHYEKEGECWQVLKSHVSHRAPGFLSDAHPTINGDFMSWVTAHTLPSLVRVSQKWKRMVPWKLLAVLGVSTSESWLWSPTNLGPLPRTPSGPSNV